MVSKKQIFAAKKNIKKAQKKWGSMSSREKALAQPEGRSRKRPGAGGGDFYRINVRSKSQFVDFRTQDVGEKGHLERIVGKRKNGNWATQCWLVSKKDAVVRGGKLIGKTNSVKDLLKTLGSDAVHVSGDNFKAKDRKNVPEEDKPTSAMKKAQAKNIKKAQAARW